VANRRIECCVLRAKNREVGRVRDGPTGSQEELTDLVSTLLLNAEFSPRLPREGW
jgi:hypothetical protein